MKKLALLLALCMILICMFASCGGDNSGNTDETTPAFNEETESAEETDEETLDAYKKNVPTGGLYDIKSGNNYTFMNCDTGRMLDADESDYNFKLEAVEGEEDTYYMMNPDSNKYYKVEAQGFTETEAPQKYEIKRCEYNRYTIATSDGLYLRDTDEGTDNDVTLGTDALAQTIEFYWFPTVVGEQMPLKIMPIGDSLTNGADSDKDVSEHYGYRKLLSKLIAEGNPDFRFVFVGSLRSGGTAMGDDISLYRHEGHNGFVIYDMYNIEPHFGIYQYMDPWLEKYSPDMFFVMLGTNDIGLTYPSGDSSRLDEITANWKLLVTAFKETIGDEGLIVAGLVPPISTNKTFNAWAKRLNIEIVKGVEELDSEKIEVVYSDINKAINVYGLDKGFCSDGGHFNDAGYEEVAKTYYATFVSTDTYKAICANIEAEINKMGET